MKINVSHYKKSDKELFINGGTLYIKNSQIIFKNMFIKIVKFDINKLIIKSLPDELFYKSLEFTDGIKSYTFLFDKYNYNKVSGYLKF